MKNGRKLVEEAANFISAHTRYCPTIGLILGSGLEGLADEVAHADIIKYEDVPNFPRLTVPGHVGELIIGELEGCTLAAMRGRPHFYEGYSMDQIGLPVRVLREIGCQVLIVTNAAGGLNPTFQATDLMLIADHINLPGMVGFNPLIDQSEEDSSERFVSMAGAYDTQLAELALAAAKTADLTLRSGVYAMVSGPSYETGTELRFLRGIGADAVGMSTAPEVIVARQCGMRVLGISCITNIAIGLDALTSMHGVSQPKAAAKATNEDPGLTHAEVLAQGRAVLPKLAILLRGFLRLLAREKEPRF